MSAKKDNSKIHEVFVDGVSRQPEDVIERYLSNIPSNNRNPEARDLLRRYLSEIHSYRELGNVALRELENRLEALAKIKPKGAHTNRSPIIVHDTPHLPDETLSPDENQTLSDRLRELSAYLHADLRRQESRFTNEKDFVSGDESAYPLFPVRVYLSENSEQSISDVKCAISRLLDALGCDQIEEGPEIFGSWFKEWTGVVNKTLSFLQFKDRLDKVEKALELTHLDIPRSSVDEKLVSAVSMLIKAVENVPSAAIQTGSILLVKTTSKRYGATIKIRTLQSSEMNFIERNPEVLWKPNELIRKLDQQLEAFNSTKTRGSSEQIRSKISATHD